AGAARPASRQRRQQRVTGLLTLSARFGAQAAVLVRAGMRFAFGRAYVAGFAAQFDGAPQQLHLGLVLTREHAAGQLANVRAVEVKAYAAGQPLAVLFGQAGVGAGSAALRTIQRRRDAGADVVELRQRFRVSL